MAPSILPEVADADPLSSPGVAAASGMRWKSFWFQTRSVLSAIVRKRKSRKSMHALRVLAGPRGSLANWRRGRASTKRIAGQFGTAVSLSRISGMSHISKRRPVGSKVSGRPDVLNQVGTDLDEGGAEYGSEQR